MKQRRGVRRVFQLASRRIRIEDAVERELQHHVQECADLLVEQGYERADAVREARRRFGDFRGYQTTCVTISRRRQRRVHMMEFAQSVIQDIRFALRGMRRYPTFAVSVILTLALGIGANAAIYTVIDATVLRPPPYPNAPWLAGVNAQYEGGFQVPAFRLSTAQAIQRSVDVDLVAHTSRQGARTDLDIPEVLNMHLFNPNIFEMLGASTLHGRPFTRNDVGPEAEPVVILSHQYWQNSFGSNPDVLGGMMRIDDVPFRIVGVLPKNLKSPRYSWPDVWLPIGQDGVVPGTSNAEGSVELLARFGEGETIEVAESRFSNGFSGLLERGEISGITGLSLRAVSDERLNADVRTALWVLAGACAVIWLIAVVNGTNLFLVRNSVRVNELRVRTSLGAGHGRIARQILTEALLLAIVSGAVAALATALTMEALVSALPSEIRSFSPNVIELSNRIVVLVFGVAALTGLLFGFVPSLAAVREARSGRVESLARATGSIRGMAVRTGLVVVQVTLAVTLLIGATLLIRSFAKLSSVDPGFEANGIMTMTVNLPESRYDEASSRVAFREEVLARLRAIPGVDVATEGSGLPSHSGFSFGGDSIGMDDATWHVTSDLAWMSRARVDDVFFPMLQIELLAGRNFRPEEMHRNDRVIVDEEFARVLFGSPEAAVGRQIRRGSDGTWERVVGVVEQSLLMSPVGSPNAFGLNEEQVTYQHYRPSSGSPRGYMTFAVRTRDRSMRVPTAMREAVATVDPLQPVTSVAWLADDYADTIAKPRFNSFLMSVLAAVATLLTLVGVYGVLSFAVSSRTRELGIRIALGAPLQRVRRLVIGSGLKVTVAGVILGAGVAIPLSRFLRTLLFDTSTTDVVSFVFVAALVVVAGILAAYIPSRRATSVDPALVLRVE